MIDSTWKEEMMRKTKSEMVGRNTKFCWGYKLVEKFFELML